MRPCVCHCDEAPPKIGYQTRGGLVPVFRVLGKEPHDDGGQRLGNLAAIREAATG